MVWLASTAAPPGVEAQELRPIGVVSLTVCFPEAGGGWIVTHLPKVYIFRDEDIATGFMSPGALRQAWVDSGHEDSIVLATGTAAKSKLIFGDREFEGSSP